MTARPSKSLWEILNNADVVTPAGTAKLFVATQPGTDFVTQIKAATVAAIVAAGQAGSSPLFAKIGVGNGASLDADKVVCIDDSANATIAFKNAHAEKAIFGICSANDQYITGALQFDSVIRADGHNIVFSVDSGTTANFILSTTGLLLSGIMQAVGGYKSSDGTAGVTHAAITTLTSITVKNGLVVAIAGT